jgi:hypothetical protein
VLAGITSSNPFALRGSGGDKSTGPGGKEQPSKDPKSNEHKGGKDGQPKQSNGNAQTKASSSATEKEQQHRKEDAAGRSKDKGEPSGRDRDKHGETGAGKVQGGGERRRRAGKAMEQGRATLASTAKELAGIWKEIKEEASRRDSSDDEAGDVQPSRDARPPEEDVVPVARIVAYSDSDSDEPLPHLPFQKQQDKAEGAGGGRSGDEAASSSGDAQGPPARKKWWPWRGSRRMPGSISQASQGMYPDPLVMCRCVIHAH